VAAGEVNLASEKTRLRPRADSAELPAGHFSMNTPPLLRDGAAAERQARVKLVETLAFAIALGLSAGGSPVVGVVLGTLVLGYGVKREGTPEQQLKTYVWRVCLLAALVSAAYIARGVLVNWADFKQGVVEGWNAV
jgi:hypothetical protein